MYLESVWFRMDPCPHEVEVAVGRVDLVEAMCVTDGAENIHGTDGVIVPLTHILTKYTYIMSHIVNASLPD